jgi:heme-degrading monooxygenase HmoA
LYARMTTIHSPRERMDAGLDKVREDILPSMRQIPGFKGIIGLVDRNANSGITISFWEDEQAMQQGEEETARLRDEAAKAMKAETEPMVNRYEVAYLEVESPVTSSVTD